MEDKVEENDNFIKSDTPQKTKGSCMFSFMFMLLLFTTMGLGGVGFITYKMHIQLKVMSADMGYSDDGSIEEDDSTKNSGGFKEKI